MKKLLALLLVFVMVASVMVLASCGEDKDTSGENSEETSTVVELTKLETLKLAFEKLKESATPDKKIIEMPDFGKDDVSVSAEITPTKIKVGEEDYLAQLSFLGKVGLALNGNIKDGKVGMDGLLKLMGEELAVDAQYDGDKTIYVNVKDVMEKPLRINAGEATDGDSDAGELEALQNIDLKALVEDLKAVITGFDWESKLTVSELEGRKDITLTLEYQDLKALTDAISAVLEKDLGDLPGFDLDMDTDDLEEGDKLTAVVTIKDELPTAITVDMISGEKTEAQVLASFAKAGDTLTATIVVRTAKDETVQSFKEVMKATVAATYADGKISLSVAMEVEGTKINMTAECMKESENKMSFALSLGAEIAFGEGVSINLDDVLKAAGTVEVKENEVDFDATISVNIPDTAEIALNAKGALKKGADEVVLPEDCDTLDTFDADAFEAKFAEKYPLIQALLDEIGSSDDPIFEEPDYYSSEEGDILLAVENTEYGPIFQALNFNYLTYTTDGKKLTFKNENGKTLFTLDYTLEEESQTGTVGGYEVSVEEYEDEYYHYIYLYSPEIELCLYLDEDNACYVSFSSLEYDGEKLSETFPDGTVYSWKIEEADDGFKLDGVLLSPFSVDFEDYDE